MQDSPDDQLPEDNQDNINNDNDDIQQFMIQPSAVEEEVDFETPGNNNNMHNKREATGTEFAFAY